MKIIERQVGDVVILEVFGATSFDGGGLIRLVAKKLVCAGKKRIVVNLGHLRSADAILGALAHARDTVTAADGQFALIGTEKLGSAPLVMKVGLEFKTFGNEGEAVRDLKRTTKRGVA